MRLVLAAACAASMVLPAAPVLAGDALLLVPPLGRIAIHDPVLADGFRAPPAYEIVDPARPYIGRGLVYNVPPEPAFAAARGYRGEPVIRARY